MNTVIINMTTDAQMATKNAIVEITARSFAEIVMRSKVPVLLAFCDDGCSASERLLAQLANAAARCCGFVTIAKTNPTESPELVERFGIVSAPAILLFSGGVVCYQFMGELSRRELDELLARAAGKNLSNQNNSALAQP